MLLPRILDTNPDKEPCPFDLDEGDGVDDGGTEYLFALLGESFTSIRETSGAR